MTLDLFDEYGTIPRAPAGSRAASSCAARRRQRQAFTRAAVALAGDDRDIDLYAGDRDRAI